MIALVFNIEILQVITVTGALINACLFICVSRYIKSVKNRNEKEKK